MRRRDAATKVLSLKSAVLFFVKLFVVELEYCHVTIDITVQITSHQPLTLLDPLSTHSFLDTSYPPQLIKKFVWELPTFPLPKILIEPGWMMRKLGKITL
jgi:hypothetical protein